MIPSYESLLPSYLRGPNIRKHGEIMDWLTHDLYTLLREVQYTYRLRRPILIQRGIEEGWVYYIHCYTDDFIESIHFTAKGVEIEDVDETITFDEEEVVSEYVVDLLSYTESTHVSSDLFILEVHVEMKTREGVTYTKHYPENDIRQNNEYDHDYTLDVIGTLLNVPRRVYSEYDYELGLYTYPAYAGKQVEERDNTLYVLSSTEDDYYYIERLQQYVHSRESLIYRVARAKYNLVLEKLDLSNQSMLEIACRFIEDFDIEHPSTYMGTAVYKYSQINKVVDGTVYYYENIMKVTDTPERVAKLRDELQYIIPCTRKAYLIPKDYLNPTFPTEDIEDSITITWEGAVSPDEIPPYTITYFDCNKVQPPFETTISVDDPSSLQYVLDIPRCSYDSYIRIRSEEQVMGAYIDTGDVDIKLKDYVLLVSCDKGTSENPLIVDVLNTVQVTCIDEKGENYNGDLRLSLYGSEQIVSFVDGEGSFTVTPPSMGWSDSTWTRDQIQGKNQLYVCNQTITMRTVWGVTIEGVLPAYELYYDDALTITGVLKQGDTLLVGKTVSLYKRGQELQLVSSVVTDSNGRFTFYYSDAHSLLNSDYFVGYLDETYYRTLYIDTSVVLVRHEVSMTVPSLTANIGDTVDVEVTLVDEDGNDVTTGDVTITLEKIEED